MFPIRVFRVPPSQWLGKLLDRPNSRSLNQILVFTKGRKWLKRLALCLQMVARDAVTRTADPIMARSRQVTSWASSAFIEKVTMSVKPFVVFGYGSLIFKVNFPLRIYIYMLIIIIITDLWKLVNLFQPPPYTISQSKSLP